MLAIKKKNNKPLHAYGNWQLESVTNWKWKPYKVRRVKDRKLWGTVVINVFILLWAESLFIAIKQCLPLFQSGRQHNTYNANFLFGNLQWMWLWSAGSKTWSLQFGRLAVSSITTKKGGKSLSDVPFNCFLWNFVCFWSQS